MLIEVRMPRLIDTMTHGTVIAWRKQVGEPVQAGEVIAEIEADKATVDLESPESGTLEQIVVPAGSEPVDVGCTLAVVTTSAPAKQEQPQEPSPVESLLPSRGNGHPDFSPAMSEKPIAEATRPGDPAKEPEINASPLAASIARQARLSLASLTSSGPCGRIVSADVIRAAGLETSARAVSTPTYAMDTASASPDATAPFEDVPHSRIRKVIAERLGESKRTIPHFYLEVNCRVDALLRIRAEIQAKRDHEPKLSINDFAVRAAALALRSVPEANAKWTDGAVRRYQRIDLAVAVATEAGLVAPVVRDADHKGLIQLALEIRDLAGRARMGKLRPEDLRSSTFTISNLGMYGIDAIYAIINPPQAGILGLGAAEPRPVAEDGSVVVRTIMTCTLSADHRLLDGATGARLLGTFKGYIEQPLTMIL
jgi:pyruvate dehydrogenase E2 component (dihydrolipoamide acetyltransferase)